MRTEDTLAKELRNGTITLDDALNEMATSTTLYVYDAVDLDPDTATWEDVEDAASGSSDLMSGFMKAGATEEQLDAVGEGITRLREAGVTIESLLGTSADKTPDARPSEPEPLT